jgi:hypothetical protein
MANKIGIYTTACQCNYSIRQVAFRQIQLRNLTLEQYEKSNPRCEIEHAGTRMIFATPNSGPSGVGTIYSKEPGTLAWIAGCSAPCGRRGTSRE